MGFELMGRALLATLSLALLACSARPVIDKERPPLNTTSSTAKSIQDANAVPPTPPAEGEGNTQPSQQNNQKPNELQCVDGGCDEAQKRDETATPTTVDDDEEMPMPCGARGCDYLDEPEPIIGEGTPLGDAAQRWREKNAGCMSGFFANSDSKQGKPPPVIKLVEVGGSQGNDVPRTLARGHTVQEEWISCGERVIVAIDDKTGRRFVLLSGDTPHVILAEEASRRRILDVKVEPDKQRLVAWLVADFDADDSGLKVVIDFESLTCTYVQYAPPPSQN